MQEKCTNTFSGLPWFLTGLGAGLSLGIFFAPQSGVESRRLIANKAQAGKDRLKDTVDRGQQYIKRQKQELFDEANGLFDRSKNAIKQHKVQLNAAFEAGRKAYLSHI